MAKETKIDRTLHNLEANIFNAVDMFKQDLAQANPPDEFRVWAQGRLAELYMRLSVDALLASNPDQTLDDWLEKAAITFNDKRKGIK